MNEYLEFKKLLEEIKSSGLKPTLLLHSCCGPCSSYVLKMLCDYFKVTIYYYNPNIYPMEEFNKRKNVQIELINKMDLDIDIIIELFSMQGQKLSEIVEHSNSAERIHTCNWTVAAAGGQPLPTGLYIMKARIVSDNGDSKSVSRKFIVLSNK